MKKIKALLIVFLFVFSLFGSFQFDLIDEEVSAATDITFTFKAPHGYSFEDLSGEVYSGNLFVNEWTALTDTQYTKIDSDDDEYAYESCGPPGWSSPGVHCQRNRLCCGVDENQQPIYYNVYSGSYTPPDWVKPSFFGFKIPISTNFEGFNKDTISQISITVKASGKMVYSSWSTSTWCSAHNPTGSGCPPGGDSFDYENTFKGELMIYNSSSDSFESVQILTAQNKTTFNHNLTSNITNYIKTEANDEEFFYFRFQNNDYLSDYVYESELYLFYAKCVLSVGAPLPPSNVSVTVERFLSGGNVENMITWSDLSADETGFKIYRSVDETVTEADTLVETVGENIEVCYDTMTAGEYYYDVMAFNDSGGNFSGVSAYVDNLQHLFITEGLDESQAQSGTISIPYTISEDFSTEVDLKAEYSIDGGTWYFPATILQSGTQGFVDNTLEYQVQDIRTGETWDTATEWDFGTHSYTEVSGSGDAAVLQHTGGWTVTSDADWNEGSHTNSTVSSGDLILSLGSETSENVWLNEDSEVRENVPTGNYGADIYLYCTVYTGQDRELYFGADLSGYSNLTKFRLYLNVDYMPIGGYGYLKECDSFDEGTIKWSNKPSDTSGVLASVNVTSTGWKYWEITDSDYLQSEQKYYHIYGGGSANWRIRSKEYTGTTYDPYVKVYYEGYNSSGEYTSAWHQFSNVSPFVSIEDITLNSQTCDIKYRSKVGSGGTPSSWYTDISNVPSGDYIQFKAEMSGDTSATPQVHSITVCQTGIYTSEWYDCGKKTNLTAADVTETLNGGTITKYFRSAPDDGTGHANTSEACSWQTTITAVECARHMQFKIEIGYGTSSPTLDTLKLFFLTENTVVWNSNADLGGSNNYDTLFRMSVSDGTYSDSDTTGEFKVLNNISPSGLTLLTPSNGYIVKEDRPTFSWYNSSDSDYVTLIYTLQICKNSQFLEEIIEYDGISEGTGGTTSKQVESADELDNDTYYFWRVKVFDGYSFSLWSDVFSFKVELPKLDRNIYNTPGNATEIRLEADYEEFDDTTDITGATVKCRFDLNNDSDYLDTGEEWQDMAYNSSMSCYYLRIDFGGTTPKTIPYEIEASKEGYETLTNDGSLILEGESTMQASNLYNTYDTNSTSALVDWIDTSTSNDINGTMWFKVETDMDGSWGDETQNDLTFDGSNYDITYGDTLDVGTYSCWIHGEDEGEHPEVNLFTVWTVNQATGTATLTNKEVDYGSTCEIVADFTEDDVYLYLSIDTYDGNSDGDASHEYDYSDYVYRQEMEWESGTSDYRFTLPFDINNGTYQMKVEGEGVNYSNDSDTATLTINPYLSYDTVWIRSSYLSDEEEFKMTFTTIDDDGSTVTGVTCIVTIVTPNDTIIDTTESENAGDWTITRDLSTVTGLTSTDYGDCDIRVQLSKASHKSYDNKDYWLTLVGITFTGDLKDGSGGNIISDIDPSSTLWIEGAATMKKDSSGVYPGTVSIVLKDAGGSIKRTDSISTDSYGSYSWSWPLPSNSPDGSWTVELEVEDQNGVKKDLDKNLTVNEYYNMTISDIVVSPSSVGAEGSYDVTCTVQNSGNKDDSVYLYLSVNTSSATTTSTSVQTININEYKFFEATLNSSNYAADTYTITLQMKRQADDSVVGSDTDSIIYSSDSDLEITSIETLLGGTTNTNTFDINSTMVGKVYIDNEGNEDLSNFTVKMIISSYTDTNSTSLNAGQQTTISMDSVDMSQFTAGDYNVQFQLIGSGGSPTYDDESKAITISETNDITCDSISTDESSYDPEDVVTGSFTYTNNGNTNIEGTLRVEIWDSNDDLAASLYNGPKTINKGATLTHSDLQTSEHTWTIPSSQGGGTYKFVTIFSYSTTDVQGSDTFTIKMRHKASITNPSLSHTQLSYAYDARTVYRKTDVTASSTVTNNGNDTETFGVVMKLYGSSGTDNLKDTYSTTISLSKGDSVAVSHTFDIDDSWVGNANWHVKTFVDRDETEHGGETYIYDGTEGTPTYGTGDTTFNLETVDRCTISAFTVTKTDGTYTISNTNSNDANGKLTLIGFQINADGSTLQLWTEDYTFTDVEASGTKIVVCDYSAKGMSYGDYQVDADLYVQPLVKTDDASAQVLLEGASVISLQDWKPDVCEVGKYLPLTKRVEIANTGDSEISSLDFTVTLATGWKTYEVYDVTSTRRKLLAPEISVSGSTLTITVTNLKVGSSNSQKFEIIANLAGIQLSQSLQQEEEDGEKKFVYKNSQAYLYTCKVLNVNDSYDLDAIYKPLKKVLGARVGSKDGSELETYQDSSGNSVISFEIKRNEKLTLYIYTEVSISDKISLSWGMIAGLLVVLAIIGAVVLISYGVKSRRRHQ